MPGVQASLLLVDDRPANLLALEAILEPLGQRLVKACSGEEALKCLLQEDFALILMDVMMPGLDGFQTVSLIRRRERSRNTPIIFLTASNDDRGLTRAYAEGAVDYIVKPFDPQTLRAKVSVFVALYLQARALDRQAEIIRERERAAAVEHAAREAAETTSQSKDEFLAMVSHELRTPLNAVLGWAELLRGGSLDPDKAQRALESVVRNARAQAQLIEDLLDISRIAAGKFDLDPQPMRLDAVVHAAVDTLRPAAEEKRQQIAVKIDALPDRFVGDATRLQQVVWNLLNNAVKFTPAEGCIDVRVGLVAGSDDQVELQVSDSGAGIPTEFLPHVFERFRQATSGGARRFGGLGLGLALVRHIVELHGGTVEARSGGEARGATFVVRLPARARQSAAPGAIVDDSASARVTGQCQVIPFPPEELPRLEGVNVLVVDDEPEARELLMAVLGQVGATVLPAGSAFEAYQVLEKERVDVVVSDLGMPIEDGYALARKLLTLGGRGSIPAIALSAYTGLEDKARALESGFTVHLPKPLQAPQLISMIARLLRREDRAARL